MKRILKMTIVTVLSLLTALLLPAQVFADFSVEYISEIKVYYSSTSSAKDEGFTILSDDKGNPVDLNENAGGGWGSKGDKAVYLGYKTTKNEKEAITDLALMNMKGNYDVAEYEALMERQMASQIIPFVENFITVIDEYRYNLESDNFQNKQRALYFKYALNKMTDDDCGGKGLGDLLVNPTKYEMGDEEYNKLSENEKKNHMDILTVVAQSNGHATLLLADLLTRAADTNDSTWLERFADLTYDDLIEDTGMAPTDARKELAKRYDDDANEILEMWDAFREQLLNADKAKEMLEEFDEDKIEENKQVLDDFDMETMTKNDVEPLAETTVNIETETEIFTNRLTDFVAKEFLDTIEYADGTMLDFFTQEYEDVADNIEMLYPLVASLTPGQRAGLEFMTLSTLVSIAGTDTNSYRTKDIDALEQVSVYEGVDRGIYEKGGVALTRDALRKNKDVLSVETDDSPFPLNWWTVLTAGTALASAIAFGITIGVKVATVRAMRAVQTAMESLTVQMSNYNTFMRNFSTSMMKYLGNGSVARPGWTATEWRSMFVEFTEVRNTLQQEIRQQTTAYSEQLARLSSRSSMCNKLMIGLGVVVIILTAVTVYLSWEDMKDYYKVDYTPIPHYIIDAKDIIGYNKKGEQIVLKNQSAYYKAVECNRTENAEFFKTLGTCADMNGDVGKQWLALYSVRKELMEPIIASSLKVVVGKEDIPSGYETGIHMFGSKTAFNLNSNLYDWNNSAPSVFVYFKTDSNALKTEAAAFTGGSVAVSCGAGIAIGAVGTALTLRAKRKKDAEKA